MNAVSKSPNLTIQVGSPTYELWDFGQTKSIISNTKMDIIIITAPSRTAVRIKCGKVMKNAL